MILFIAILLINRYIFSCLSVTITYEDRDGDMQSVNAKCGDTLLDVAKNNDIDLEGKLF